MDFEIFWRVVTFLLFAGLGYAFAQYLTPPRSAIEWIGLLALLVLAEHFMVSGKLIAFEGVFTLYLNNTLQGLLFGVLAGFLSRRLAQSPIRSVP